MSLEERIQQSVDAALASLRARVEQDVRSIVRDLVSAAEQDRSEAEARVRAGFDELVEQARAEEREAVQEDAWRLAEAKAEQRVEEVLAASRAELQRVLTTTEERAQQAMRESVTAAHIEEREAEMAAIARLLESIRGLDGATSLSEVLDALGLAAGREASRAAVFVLRADRLHGWKLSGFGARDTQPKALEMSLADGGVLGHAVTAARPITTRDSQHATNGAAFAELPEDRMGLAVPVIVGGRVVAVVYADSVTGGSRPHLVPSSWPEVIEILARHAARCLEALTVQKSAATASPRSPGKATGQQTDAETAQNDRQAPTATQNQPPEPTDEAKMSRVDAHESRSTPEQSARRLARLLLSEIRLYHEPAVDEGRRSRNLLSRLGPEIARARRLYEAQVPASLRTRAELFHQELIATLAGGDPRLLGAPA